ncbi:MAG: hypothetical protein V3R99_02395 [Thermoguttaceae bacterium]
MRTDYQWKLRRLLLVSLYVFFGASAICQALSPRSLLLAFVFPVAIASTVTFWCVVDSRILGRPMLRVLQMLTFFTWPIAVPLYLVWSRRLRGVGLVFLHALGLMATLFIVFYVTIVLAYGPAILEHYGL